MTCPRVWCRWGLQGFRYASQSEVVNLINNFGFSPYLTEGENISFEGNTGTDQLSGLVDLLGTTSVSVTNRHTWGITSTPHSSNGLNRFVQIVDRISHAPGDDRVDYAAFRQNDIAENTGSFLVRTSPSLSPPAS